MQHYHQTNSAWCMSAQRRHKRLTALMPEQSSWLYGVIDAAADEAIYTLLQQEARETPASEILCLYDGNPGIRYARYAPYLLKIHANSRLAEHWLAQGWAAHWGIFFFSAQSPRQIKTHLKKLLTVRIDGKKALLRFYDPRVLPDILTSMTPTNTSDFFGKGAILKFLAPQGSHGEFTWSGEARFNNRLHKWLGAASLQQYQVST